MSFFAWASRRIGGLSVVALLSLCYWVVSQDSTITRNGFNLEQADRTVPHSIPQGTPAGVWTFVFAYYSLFIHFLVVLVPIRACRAIWDLTKTMQRSSRNQLMQDYLKSVHSRRGSQVSLSSSSSTLTPGSGSSASSNFGDEAYTDGKEIAQDTIIHAIIIPNYKEEIDTLRETLEVLASHPRARTSYDIYLGMEQREVNGEAKALTLSQDFAKKFRSIDYSIHPDDIPGEAAGKGSNIGWAARKLSAKYVKEDRSDVVITGIDADSHLSSNYFNIVANMHLSHPETATTTMYAAPIVFDRNAHRVAALVRVADVAWSAAGMSGLYRGSSIAPPTSVYSLPLELVDRVGGWDTDAEAIGEDLHMYIKCFFALNGNLTCQVVPSPVSQSNVSGDGATGFRGMLSDVKARYKQSIRHMWGALDSGFALRQGVEMWQERKHTSRAFRPLHSGNTLDSYMAQPIDVSAESGIFSDVTQDTLPEPHWEHIFYLGHRLFEAHFLPVHMTILVLASALYLFVTDGNDDPNDLAWTFRLSNIFRTTSFMLVIVLLFLYESYHRVAVDIREKEMADAGLDRGMCFSRRTWRSNFVDYALMPVVAPLYGAIPCMQAEISHFWTQDLVYTVSKKAIRQQARSIVDIV